VLGGDEEMRKRAFRYVSFALIVSALLLSPQVARADIIFGASSGGNTEAHSCSADVWFIVIPVSLDIDEDDTIRIWFNTSWYDNRSANSPEAIHYFKVNWTYGAQSDYNDIQYNSTGGNVGYPVPFFVDVKDVDPPGKLGITWFAAITITSPYCFDSDSKVYGINLV
jgi:hypothetical protein